MGVGSGGLTKCDCILTSSTFKTIDNGEERCEKGFLIIFSAQRCSTNEMAPADQIAWKLPLESQISWAPPHISKATSGTTP